MRCFFTSSLDGSDSCLFQVTLLPYCAPRAPQWHCVVVGPTLKSRRGVWSLLARVSLECLQVKEDVIQPYRAPHEPRRSEEEEGNDREQGSG